MTDLLGGKVLGQIIECKGKLVGCECPFKWDEEHGLPDYRVAFICTFSVPSVTPNWSLHVCLSFPPVFSILAKASRVSLLLKKPYNIYTLLIPQLNHFHFPLRFTSHSTPWSEHLSWSRKKSENHPFHDGKERRSGSLLINKELLKVDRALL